MNKLLLDEAPLIIIPSLAVKVGLNEAIFLQQLHYWLERSSFNKNGQNWVYKTMEEWLLEFPFWSKPTLKRVIKLLRDLDILKVEKLSKSRVNYYTIEYQKLDISMGQSEPNKEVNLDSSMGQSEPQNRVKVNHSTAQSDPIPIYNENQREYTETTTENTTDIFKAKTTSSKKMSWEQVSAVKKDAIREKIKAIENRDILTLNEFEDALMAKGYQYANFVTAYKLWINKSKRENRPKKDLLRNIPTQFEISDNW